MSACTRYLLAFLLVGLLGSASCGDKKETVSQPDSTPPAMVSTLAAGTATSNSVPLTWTAVGDDAATGTASTYDLRYSNSTITAANWAATTQVTGEPTPQAAGQAESFTVTGLTAEATYSFALKVGDDVPNWSALSNVVTGTTSSAGAQDYEASQTISTTEAGEVTTASGASISVPLYAVPLVEGGADGQMVFSIELDESAVPTPPTGTTTASDVYRFGPDGFTFGEMVEVTIPVTGEVGDNDIAIFRIDQTTGNSEPYSGIYDPVAGTVTAQTYHLSPWYVGTYDPTSTAYGAFHVTNNSATHWLNICVVGYELDYPTADANFTGDAYCTWAPTGHIGWASSGNWYLPQGTYRLCVSMSRSGTISTPPGEPSHGFVEGARLANPWTRTNPQTTSLSYSSPPSLDEGTGPCDCTPVPSTSVGTGEVQVTLTWHSAEAIDLDLFVTEPGGERCYYGNTVTTTGGTLDRDNLCSNYINGRPENIYWIDAPAGTYTVAVSRWSTCSSGPSTQSFDVRVVTGSTTRTYTGTVTDAASTVQVATFTLASSPLTGFAGDRLDDSVSFSDYLGTPIESGPMPSKN